MKSEIGDPKERGRVQESRLHELHVIFYEMNLIEQVEWINEAKRTPIKRICNWIIHIIILAIFVSSIIITTTSPHHFHDYLIAIAGGYIVAVDIYAFEWLIKKTRHKHYG